eukprot:comp17612_c0_seq1/m.17298 comp17612_c0_seq1/g.17298  ORF comp17612_c0_seq1/g.17298 comp17612_c0_seq1/m.17298 type:complete len:478 (-) comp17612_c0_seq1:334-1767(-)
MAHISSLLVATVLASCAFAAPTSTAFIIPNPTNTYIPLRANPAANTLAPSAVTKLAPIGFAARSPPSTRTTSTNRTTTTTTQPATSTGASVSCDIAVGQQCYTDLASAIRNAPSNSTIYLNRDGLTVSSEIHFSKSLTLAGNPNSRAQVRLYGNTASDWGAMFRATGNGQAITLRHIYFECRGSSGSVLRTPDLGQSDQPTKPDTTISLTIVNCTFNNFISRSHGGAAIFVGRTSGLRIENSTFTNNYVPNYIDSNGNQILMWLGGGAVWVREGRGPIDVVNNYVGNNTFEYPHSLGAALMIESITATTNINNNVFEKNTASAGGALYIALVADTALLKINSVFKENVAYNYGWKSRGGAMWIERVYGTAEIRGTYIGNVANRGRGGAIANNQVTGSVLIDATFTNNVAGTSGAIWDSWAEGKPMNPGARFTIKSTSKHSGNRASNGQQIYILEGRTRAVQYQTASIPQGQDLSLRF